MTYNEVLESASKLNAVDQSRLIDQLRRDRAWSNSMLRTGAKVQFKVKGGGFISGTLISVKRKNAEVLSVYRGAGIRAGSNVTWRVPLTGIIPCTPEQVKVLEFPAL